MNKLLVVVPYKLCFAVATLYTRGLLGSRKYILGTVVIKFNHIGCGVGDVLINNRRI